ncbi:MAG: MSMEG_4193 family putative phosphomutase [Micromonosporaceae bacterium]|nr:MSMEG_4193 family putative phosphomutase [Micromonosporaceae bacterium]
MATVLLVRHGRTAANADGGLAGRSPVGLDETGRAQAAALAERLRAVPLAAVVTSPLPRCRQTVAVAVPGLAAAVEERLIECGYGDWQGRPLKQLVDDPLWPVVQQHPSAVTFPGEGGEAMAGMAARAVAAVRDWDARVTAAHGAEAVWLACSHGDVIKAVVADALGLHLDQFQRIVVDPGSVTAIRYTPVRPFLLRLGDAGELRFDPPATGAGSDAAVGGGAGGGSFGGSFGSVEA